MLAIAGPFVGVAHAQSDSDAGPPCPTAEQLVSGANAIVVGSVVEVRDAAPDGEYGDVVVIDILSIEKGGAQNPLAVTYPKNEPFPDLVPETELNVVVQYDTETGRASSTIACGRTIRADGEPLLIADENDRGDLATTAGETARQALTVLGFGGAAVIGLTLFWRFFREFRPRLS